MADLNFYANLFTNGWDAGVKKISASSKAVAKDVQASFNNIKVNVNSGAIESARKLGFAYGTALNGATDSAYKLGMAYGKVSIANENFSNGIKQIGSELRVAAAQDGPAFRYAMYDVAGSLQQLSLVAGSAGVAVLTMSAKYETAFTAIERTTMAGESSLGHLKSQFMALSHEIPLAFSELTNIGALGAQMGIADSELAGFTETVAQFSATTNVSIESAAQQFGALKNLLDIDATGFTALGSAVAYVGINSVATETEVLSVATAIGGVAAQAGTSKEFVIGLSGALASLRVPAEQSRGALTRVFQEINRSAAEGGPQFENFARILNMTTEEAKALAGSNIEEFFLKFNQGLSGMSAQELTTALDSVNLSDIRVTNTLARLSSNMDVVNKSMADSAYGFENSAVLSALYANKAEDLASKFQILINSLSELGAKLGDAVSPTFGAFIDWLAKRAQDLSVALSTGAGKSLAAFAGIIGSATTVVFGLAGAIALATASLAAFNFVKDKLGLSAVSSALSSLTQSWIATTFSTQAATAATTIFKGALLTTGIGAAVVLLGTLAASFMQVGTDAESASAAFSNMVANTSGLADALAADEAARTQAVVDGNWEAVNSYVAVNDSLFKNTEANDENAQKVRNTAEVLGMTAPALAASNAALEANTVWLGDNARAWLRNQLIQSETFQNMVGNADFMKYFNAVGADMNEVIDAATIDGQQGVINYFKGLEQVGVGAAAIASGNISSAFQLQAGARGFGSTLGRLKSGPFEVVSNSIGDISKSFPGYTNALKLAGNTADASAKSTDDYAGAIGNLGGAADSAKNKIYTLVDYANDLSSVFTRAFDIRFSGGQTLDKISSAFSKIAKATADARDEINALNADISKLEADQALQKYFLSVAEAYGDTLKAQEIRANLAKIDVDLVKKTKDLQKAQDKTNKTLIGNTDAAIDNRSEILDLVSSYQDHVKALAASGVKEDELKAKSAQLKAEFMAQATQLGYNADELGKYAAAFDDVAYAIDNIPRNITIDIDANPAKTALDELLAKAQSVGSGVGSAIQQGVNDGLNAATDALANFRSTWMGRSNIVQQLAQAESAVRNGIAYTASRRAQNQTNYDYWLNQLAMTFSSGGYTGAGGKYEPAGIVHKGEYVVPKEQVNQATGTPYFMSQPRSFAQGGYVGGNAGGGMVSLSPEDRALLRNVGGSGNIVLYADSKELARSVNDGNRQIVASGGRP